MLLKCVFFSQDKMVVKMALVLLLLGAHTVSSQHQLCGTYYLGGNSQQNMTAKRGDWTVKTFRSSVDLRKIMVYGNCLMLVDRIVYGSSEQHVKVNSKVREIKCFCEFVSQSYKKFLKRHVIDSVPADWNELIKKREIPADNRFIHTFIRTTKDEVKKICGNRRKRQHCLSREKFDIYNLRKQENGQYSEPENLTTQIAVRCEWKRPVHFDCYVDNNNPDCINKYNVCQ